MNIEGSRVGTKKLVAALLVILAMTVSSCTLILREPRIPGATGQGVKIAVIDKLVEWHPYFEVGEGTVAMAERSPEKDPWDYWDKVAPSHGMLVAGAVKFAAPGAEIVVYSPPDPGIFDNLTIWYPRMIDWAREDGADIIAMSVGTTGDFLNRWKGALDRAEDAGIPIFVAAGNNGDYDRCPEGSYGGLDEGQLVAPKIYWESHPNLVVVGGSEGDEIWRCSIYGEPVDFYAPAIWLSLPVLEGKYADSVMGTSFSAPAAAGAAARLIELDPGTYRGDPAAIVGRLRSIAMVQSYPASRGESQTPDTAPEGTQLIEPMVYPDGEG